jgi:hypothetical protein
MGDGNGGRVRGVDPVADTRFDAFVAGHPEATVFHLGAWAAILGGTYGYRPRYLAAEREGRLTGVLPLMLTRGLVSGRRLRSLPTIGNGGPLGETPDDERALLVAAAEFVPAEARSLVLLSFRDDLPVPGGAAARERVPTWIVHDLDVETAALKKRSPQLHRHLRRAEREGVVFCEYEGEAALRRFYAFYLEVMRRRHSLPRPYRQFDLARRLLPAGAYRLFGVEREGAMLAGCICHPFRGGVELLYSASDERAWNARPNHAMWWGVIRWAAEHGFAHVDLGDAQPESGLADFKRMLLAEPVPKYAYQLPAAATAADRVRRSAHGAGRAKQAPSLRSRVLRAGWDRAPLKATELAGRIVYRYA